MITFKTAEVIEAKAEHLGVKISRPTKNDFPLSIQMPCKFQIIANGKKEKGLKGQFLVFIDFNTPIIKTEEIEVSDVKKDSVLRPASSNKRNSNK